MRFREGGWGGGGALTPEHAVIFDPTCSGSALTLKVRQRSDRPVARIYQSGIRRLSYPFFFLPFCNPGGDL